MGTGTRPGPRSAYGQYRTRSAHGQYHTRSAHGQYRTWSIYGLQLQAAVGEGGLLVHVREHVEGPVEPSVSGHSSSVGE